MTTFIHPVDEGTGLSSDTYIFHQIREPVSNDSRLVNAYGDGYVGVSDAERVFGPMMKTKMRSALMSVPQSVFLQSRQKNFDTSKHIVLPDIGISVRDMFVKFGQDAFQNDFLETCEAMGVADVTDAPTWRIIQRKDAGGFNQMDGEVVASYSLRVILYASLLFYLTRGKALNKDAYHYRLKEPYDQYRAAHLLQKNGRMYLVPVQEESVTLGDLVRRNPDLFKKNVFGDKKET